MRRACFDEVYGCKSRFGFQDDGIIETHCLTREFTNKVKEMAGVRCEDKLHTHKQLNGTRQANPSFCAS